VTAAAAAAAAGADVQPMTTSSTHQPADSQFQQPVPLSDPHNLDPAKSLPPQKVLLGSYCNVGIVHFYRYNNISRRNYCLTFLFLALCELKIQGVPKKGIPNFIFGITSVIQHRF